MAAEVQGRIQGLSQFYVGGLERIEIWINKKDASALLYVEGKRVAVQLVVAGNTYQAGLRATSRNPYVWICPDLIDSDGARTNLAEVLHRWGYKRNQPVSLYVSGNLIHLRPAG